MATISKACASVTRRGPGRAPRVSTYLFVQLGTAPGDSRRLGIGASGGPTKSLRYSRRRRAICPVARNADARLWGSRCDRTITQKSRRFESMRGEDEGVDQDNFLGERIDNSGEPVSDCRERGRPVFAAGGSKGQRIGGNLGAAHAGLG